MNLSQFWQNFKLGQEQEIAAGFIYDGLKLLDCVDTLNEERELFPILYNLSIGLERLAKVVIVLAEYNENTNVEKFEKSFKNHNLTRLCERVSKATKFTMTAVHHEFLEMLSVFYNEQRYDRLSFSNLTVFSKDKHSFLEFLHKYIGIDIQEDPLFFIIENTTQIKEFIGGIVKDIAQALFKEIQKLAGGKNLYTDEISSSSSKAGKIFFDQLPLTFRDERRAMMEIIVFLLQEDGSSLVDTLKTLEALPLDPALNSEYLKALIYQRPKEMQRIMDEIEACHEEISEINDRLDLLDTVLDSQ